MTTHQPTKEKAKITKIGVLNPDGTVSGFSFDGSGKNVIGLDFTGDEVLCSGYTINELKQIAKSGLLPCPFCGSVPQLKQHNEIVKETNDYLYAINCKVCPLSMAFLSPKEAIIERWNTRAI